MAPTPGRSPLKPDELAAIFDVDDDALRDLDELEPRAQRTTPRRRARRRISLADRVRGIPKWAFLVAGIAIGWLIIGWWLWPVRWTNSDPWEMSVKNQKTYVQLVADRYWYTRDLTQAEDALNGWNRDDVNTLLIALQSETIDADARQRLDALTQALSLPGGEQSLLESIFSQEGIIIALFIATLPMMIALGLVVVSRVKVGPAAGKEGGAEDQEADLEELLADVELEQGLTSGGPGPDGAPATPEGGQENKPDEKQPGQEEEQKEEEEEDEEKVDANNPLGDLASLFAEEDTSLTSLEALCKGMPDLNADDLLATARTILRRFKEERRKPGGV